jgi:hypothetical protein
MKKDGSLNWFEKAFVDSFDHPLFAIGCGAFTLAAGLSIAAIVNHSFSEESRQNSQNAEVSRCIPDIGPTRPEGPR